MKLPYIKVHAVVQDTRSEEKAEITFPIMIHTDHIWSYHSNLADPSITGCVVQYKGQPMQLVETMDELSELILSAAA